MVTISKTGLTPVGLGIRLTPSHLQWLSVRNQWIGHFRVLAGYNNTCVIISGMEKAYSSLHLQSIDVTELSFLHHHHLSWFWKLMWNPLSLKKSNLQFLEAEKHVRTGVINLKTTASKSTRFYEIRLNPMASRYELWSESRGSLSSE